MIGFRDVRSHTCPLPPGHGPRVLLTERHLVRTKRATRYDLAILYMMTRTTGWRPPTAMSHRSLRTAAQEVGFGVEVIDRDDYGRLSEFDALFIRETTAVNHHTFRFAQRAEAEGLVVIDDPQSILRCTNKVYLNEAFEVNEVPTPRTWITDNVDAEEVAERIGFPCVLKVPDSAFSQGDDLAD